jgi:Tfp pilus assembly protein PilF
VPGIAPTALDAAYVSDPRYQQQRAALVRQLQARLAALPAQERDKVTASLEAIEKAKADLEQALGHDPSNALLQELLVNTYQDEMRVLTDVHQASDPGRGI